MSTLSECNKTLINGVGKCSVPMWSNGMPAGFCDNEAFSRQTEDDKISREWKNDFLYVPALACSSHGGLSKKEALNLCDFCENNIAVCKSEPKFGNGKGNDNIYECDKFKSKPKYKTVMSKL